jgi:hypothetical protein
MSPTSKPVVDLRIYKMRRGGVPRFLELTDTMVIPVMLRHVGPPLAYFVTDIGPQDEVIHLWGYDSLGDMETRRRARNLDPQWPQYPEASRGLIERQDTRVGRSLALPILDGVPAPDPAKRIVEFRITSLHRGPMPEYQKLLQTLALPVQLRHFGPQVALYTADIGPQNEVVQLWSFDSLADYEARRAARDREPDWARFLAATESMVASELTRLSRRAQFASLPGR